MRWLSYCGIPEDRHPLNVTFRGRAVKARPAFLFFCIGSNIFLFSWSSTSMAGHPSGWAARILPDPVLQSRCVFDLAAVFRALQCA